MVNCDLNIKLTQSKRKELQSTDKMTLDRTFTEQNEVYAYYSAVRTLCLQAYMVLTKSHDQIRKDVLSKFAEKLKELKQLAQKHADIFNNMKIGPPQESIAEKFRSFNIAPEVEDTVEPSNDRERKLLGAKQKIFSVLQVITTDENTDDRTKDILLESSMKTPALKSNASKSKNPYKVTW